MHLRITLGLSLLCFGVACAADGPDTGARRTTSEGEGDEGEGDEGEGEGEGDVVGEGEGDVGGEGEGDVGGEGEGDGGVVGGEGEGEGDVEIPVFQTVLLIGNSQLGLNPPDITEALESMSEIAHDGASVLAVDRKQNFGEGCSSFLNRADVTDAAASGDYDVVVLAPSIGEGAANAGCWQDFRELAEGAGSRFAIMSTAHVRSQYPGGFDALDQAVKNYADSQGVQHIPLGRVWRRLLGNSPSANQLSAMYSSDNQHPGVEGDLVYVYTLYSALTGLPSTGLPPDVLELRCDMTRSCLSYQALDDCVSPCTGCSPTPGEYNCAAQNGAIFGPNGIGVAFVTTAEAATYQAAVDAILAE